MKKNAIYKLVNILILVFIMSFVFVSNIYASNEVSKVKGFKGRLKNNNIVLSWKSVKNADGYMLYKNNKFLKKIKSNKKQFIDKKVKKKKTYSYYIVAYKKINSQVVSSKKTYTIKIKKYTKKSKKQNVSKVAGTNKIKSVGISESIRLSAKAKVKKGLKKKKVYSKKIYWSSSDKSLATVDQKGKVTANSNMKTGTLKIYARAHSGVKKCFKVKVVDYAKPGKFDDKGTVYEVIKPVITTFKSDSCDIASYYFKNVLDKKVTISINSSGDGLKTEPEIVIPDGIKNKMLPMMRKEGVHIEIDRDMISFCNEVYYETGGVFIYRIHYCFNKQSDFDAHYLNMSYSQIAPRWYYEEERHFSDVY